MDQETTAETEEAPRLTFRQATTAKERREAGIWVEDIFDTSDVFGDLHFRLLPETDPRCKAAFDDGVKDQCATNSNGAKAKNYLELSVDGQRAVIRWWLATAIVNVRGTVPGWPNSEDPDDPELDADLVFPGTRETSSASKAQWGEVMRSPGFPVRALYKLQEEVKVQSADTPQRDLEIATVGEDCAFGSLARSGSTPTDVLGIMRALVER